MHHGYKHDYTCIVDTCIMDKCIIDSCILDVEVLVNFAWVTRPERPKGAKDDVKRPKVPPPRSLLVDNIQTY